MCLSAGVSLLNGRAGEEREAVFEAAAAEHTSYYGAAVARR